MARDAVSVALSNAVHGRAGRWRGAQGYANEPRPSGSGISTAPTATIYTETPARFGNEPVTYVPGLKCYPCPRLHSAPNYEVYEVFHRFRMLRGASARRRIRFCKTGITRFPGSTRWLRKDEEVGESILYGVSRQGEPMEVYVADLLWSTAPLQSRLAGLRFSASMSSIGSD